MQAFKLSVHWREFHQLANMSDDNPSIFDASNQLSMLEYLDHLFILEEKVHSTCANFFFSGDPCR
jgi:hypothetical protein